MIVKVDYLSMSFYCCIVQRQFIYEVMLCCILLCCIRCATQQGCHETKCPARKYIHWLKKLHARKLTV